MQANSVQIQVCAIVSILPKKKHVCSRCRRKIFCTFPFHGWQFFVSWENIRLRSLRQHYLHIFFNIYFCCSRGLLNIYQPQTHWRVRTGSTQVVCLDSQCSRLLREHIFRQSGSLCTVYIISVALQCPVARVGGGVLTFQVDDDLGPCSSQILKPPAARRTWTCRL